MDAKKIFEVLNGINVNGRTEKKDNLTYLSWPWAWAEVMKRYPEATYEIVKTDGGLPYVASELGVMVYTRVTINDMTREMWLPVMDFKNRAMKIAPYEVKTRYGVEVVPSVTMYDVNKAIMRCLVKNLAMFGLGLYIFAGEDLPEDEKKEAAAQAAEEARQKIASWVDCSAQQNAEGLAQMFARRQDFAENQEVIDAMYERLHAIINEAPTQDELGKIYTTSQWAHGNQQVVDWCAERKRELQKTA